MSNGQAASGIADLKWFKSSYSDGGGGNCVEVATAPGAVHVRDSKDKAGPSLAFSVGEWSAFVAFAASVD